MLYKTYVCYITHIMLSYKTHDMLCYITRYVIKYNTY